MWSITDIVLFLLTDQQMGRWGRERQLPSQVDLNTANLAATLVLIHHRTLEVLTSVRILWRKTKCDQDMIVTW